MRRRSSKWIWPWPPPRLGDVGGFLFIAIVLAVVLVGYLRFPSMLGFTRPDLGADWTCANPGRGEAVCVRRIGAPKATARDFSESAVL